jgi:uncharacterized phage-associated protein
MTPKTRSSPIRFAFDERKATAAASRLLQLADRHMHYLELVKLLYYADRDSLDLYGQSITGDRYVNMRHGPVLSTVYDLVKHTIFAPKPRKGAWAEHVTKRGRWELELKGQPDFASLSDAQLELLERVFTQRRERTRWELRDKSHTLPEWEDPGGSSRELPIEQILRVLGKGDEEIEAVRHRAEEQRHFARIFAART